MKTTYDRRRGIFNDLFAAATPQLQAISASSSPPVKKPNGQRFLVRNIYADFKRHDLGSNFGERNFDGTFTKEFMTEPLWGVGFSALYGHDGRSVDLWLVIMRHGGEAREARNRFARLPEEKQGQVIDFLQSLVVFPSDYTASNLNPGNPQTPNFPTTAMAI